MRFEVHNDIDIEDKIFGPFSWRQFLYLGGGVGMGVALFLAAPFIVFVIFGLPITILAAALAFYPVNNRPFSFFLEGIFDYYRHSSLYIWKLKDEVVHRERNPRRTEIVVTNTVNRPKRLGGSATVSSLARRLELEVIQKDIK